MYSTERFKWLGVLHMCEACDTALVISMRSKRIRVSESELSDLKEYREARFGEESRVPLGQCVRKLVYEVTRDE
jgi:hypothetical protein